LGTQPSDVTTLLQRWKGGDEQALEALTPIVYGELHKLAKAAFAGERRNHTLQPTAVLHEAYLRLVDVSVEWQDSTHFYALAARLMRRLLINHARDRRAEKRGGGRTMLSFAESRVSGEPEPDEDVLELDAAMSALAERDQRKADIVELHYFGGMTHEQIADALDVSAATVKRDLGFSKAWIRRWLEDSG